MNSRSQTFDLKVDGRQVDEAVACLFHTVLFYRTMGKFTYDTDGTLSIGTLGYRDVDSDFIDITYVCCSSTHLDGVLKKEISRFSDSLRKDNQNSGQISLEFFQKKKTFWPLQPECIPWEIWTVRLELLKLYNEHERQLSKESLGEELNDKIIHITEIINRHEYVPSTPPQAELEYIFDTSFPDVQPYLFKLGYVTSSNATPSVSNTFRRLIKETLQL